MRSYHLVLVRESGKWHLENGFYNKDCAKDEIEDLRSHHKAKDLKILTVSNTQAAIESAINALNNP